MTATALAAALVLDAGLGEPRAIWSRVSHPAVLIGRGIGWADRRFNAGHRRKLRGALVVAVMVAIAFASGKLLAAMPGGPLIEVLVAAILLAQRSLADHVRAVAAGLRYGVDAGKQAVAMIVGRDTARMDETAIARAAIESASENFADGVVAPWFWFLVGGLPGMLVYKAVNTADSMIGYRTQRHADFGWSAARLDDLLNWVPARMSAIVLLVAGRRIGCWRQVSRDAVLHRSPNAGWPEAAAAHVLGVSISGPRHYDGALRDYTFVNDGAKQPDALDVDRAVALLWRAWGVLLATTVAIAVIA